VEGARYPVTIVCASPEGMPAARDHLGDLLDATRVIGLWWWEVPAFPSRFLRAFDDVDEVWVGSRFVADVLAAVAPVPVVRMALPVDEPRPAAVDRAALGLPDGFTFGFVFDYASVVERKNPAGLIAAFRRAFPPGGDEAPALVLKTIGGDRHADAHGGVLAAAAEHPGIHVIDRHLAPAEKDALIAHLDCYVSLHRSEGFGLTLAEAALLNVPVVATDYGGTRDFLTPFNAFLVDYRVAAIGPGHDPYPAEGEWAEPDLDHAAALMREVRSGPDRARVRAARAAADMRREHSPAAAGSVMAQRIARMLRAPHRGDAVVSALDLEALQRRLRGGVAERGGGGVRGGARRALLRVLRPYSVHQRLLDEEIVRAVRTLDERVRGVAAAQSVLAEELRELRSDDGGNGVPPSPAS
jgi:glycosyltransferase involved in cell wall biosynthesis